MQKLAMIFMLGNYH